MAENQTYELLNDPEMKEIVESFIVETKEIQEQLDIDLVELEKRPDDMDLLNQVFRSFHTIKGTSGFLGLEKLTRVTHRCEDILNKLRKGEAVLTPDLMDGILLAFDRIKDLVSTIEESKNENVEVEGVIDFLTQLLETMESGKSAPVQKPENETAPDPSVDEVKNEENNKDTEETPKSEPEAKQPKETTAQPQSGGNGASSKKGETSIRVDVERLDELLNIASELVLGRNRLSQVNSDINLEYEGTQLSRDLAEATKLIDLMTNELQLAVMKTRMVKIGKVFNRFPRLVRDLARETNKEIKLEIKGEETELDKTLIEEINDPLVHLVRNAVDHGIENPDVRKKAGKESAGTISLSAEQEGNNIVIYIEDDGKGIDPEVIKNKAVEKGLITKDKAAELSKQEAYNLIFLPGFSTAEKITNVSGRGVGMDVVKTNVTNLRGIINVESNVGEGSKFIIKLPLTLAIIPGMIVEVRGEKIVVPLNSIIEVVRVNTKDISTINQREVIKIRDIILPLINIDHVLHYGDYQMEEKEWQYIVVIGIAEKRYGIKVDKLIGQKEVVIKSLGSFLKNIHGIAGSTIMGDGSVVMILDIVELLHNLSS